MMIENEPLQGFQISPQQKHIWMQQKDTATSHAQCTVLIEGSLDRERLNRALQACIAHHEILRTSFQSSQMLEIPWQIIHNEAQVSRQDRDISMLNEQEQERSLLQLAIEQRALPFDIEHGPLIRTTLVALSASRHALLLDIAALCADTSTCLSIVEELAQLYGVSQQDPELLEAPLQYADFASWQLDTLEQDIPEAAHKFWQRHLQQPGHLHPKLPLQLAAGPSAGSTLASQSKTVEQALVVQARKFAEQHQVSMESIFFTCWTILLWRLSGVTDLESGLIAQGRAVVEAQTLLGPVARCLPLHFQIDEHMDGSQLINKVDAMLLEAREWEAYFDPQSRSSALQAQDGEWRVPMAFEYCEWPAYQTGELTFKVIGQHVCMEHFDMKLTCSVGDQGLTVDIDYHPALYSPEVVEHFFWHYLTLLQDMLRDSSTALARLNILSDSQRQFLQDISTIQVAYPAGRCIHHQFQEQARRTPERLAVVYEDQQLTYAELNRLSNRLAHFLRKQAARPDVPIALLSEKSVGMIVGLLAILKAGSAYVPLNPEHSIERLAQQLSEIQAPIILTQQRYRKHLSSYQGLIFCLDADWELVAGEPETNPTSTVLPEQLAYIIYTSGSTGVPKGVMVTHASLLNYVHAMGSKLSLWDTLEKPPLQFAHVSALDADLGNTVIFLSLATGGCLHLISQERATDSQLLAHYVAKQSIDVIKITPSHLAALLATPEGESLLPAAYLVIGGESLPFSLIDRITASAGRRQIFNHYGPTETTIGSVVYDLNRQERAQMYQTATVAIGRPLENVELYILDRELQMVPVGVPGELYIGGACLARGYFCQPDQTAQSFIPNPFNTGEQTRLYKTGDIGRYLPDGNIEFLRRVDQQVKIRGFRVELGEVEAAIRRHPDIDDVATIVRENGQGNKQLIAYVTVKQASETLTSDLQSYLRRFLPDYMLPSVVIVLRRFPLTANGKLDYRSLPAPDQASTARSHTFVAPRTPSEEIVVTLMAQLLGLERVSVDENFFDLGGHSLLATQLIARLREAFQLELPVRLLFDMPTAAELSLGILAYAVEQEDAEEMDKIFQEVQKLE